MVLTSGFFERRLGDLVDKFGFIRKKSRIEFSEISYHVKNLMALANINDFKEIVKQKIFPSLVSKQFASDDELDEYWVDWMTQKREWFSDRIIPIENEVSFFSS